MCIGFVSGVGVRSDRTGHAVRARRVEFARTVTCVFSEPRKMAVDDGASARKMARSRAVDFSVPDYEALRARLKEVVKQLPNVQVAPGLVQPDRVERDHARCVHELGCLLRGDLTSFDLRQLRGKVVLAINVASSDVAARQMYSRLAMLHDRFGDAGLEILAFPSDFFGEKELCMNEQIRSFVEHTCGSIPCHLMDRALRLDENPVLRLAQRYFPEPISWNFDGQYLFDRSGSPVARFSLKSSEQELISAIEAYLRN